MKHDWKRDENGEIKPLFEYADHPVTECRACGVTSGCLEAVEYCTAIGAEPLLDADDCEGLDLGVTVSIRISHPGAAREHDDQASVAMSTILPLEQVLDAKRDLVVDAIGSAVEVITGSWRGARTTHEPAWRTAAGRCMSCDHRTEFHGPEGCRYGVTNVALDANVVCPCTVEVSRG